jgi:hypothetical protein
MGTPRYKVRKILLSKDYYEPFSPIGTTLYLTDEFGGKHAPKGDEHFRWAWYAHIEDGESFFDEEDAKYKLRTNRVRYSRSLRTADGRPVWGVQIVECNPDNPRETEKVVWPKEDVPVLDRLAVL